MPNKTKPQLAALRAGLCAGLCALFLAACSPTVKVEAPDKPIEINMNIKIEQEVKVKVEKDLADAFANDPELFGSAATAPSTEGTKQ